MIWILLILLATIVIAMTSWSVDKDDSDHMHEGKHMTSSLTTSSNDSRGD